MGKMFYENLSALLTKKNLDFCFYPANIINNTYISEIISAKEEKMNRKLITGD